MHITNIDDPRDELSRIRRKPLENYFKATFPERWRAGMAADVMRIILRAEGIFSVPNAPLHRLGASTPTVTPPTQSEVDAAEDATERLYKEWEQSMSYDKMGIRDLRKECKSRGIKMKRTDNMETLRAKLRGENTS